MKRDEGIENAAAELARFGMLLLQDPEIPSVAGLVAGERIRGSWWGHSRAHEIFEMLMRLSSRADVLMVKLIAGKVTFVQRRLWPALITVAQSKEAWQTRRLSPAARVLLAAVASSGSLRTDALPPRAALRIGRPGGIAKELEERLLIYAEEIHTEKGAHAKRLESWANVVKRTGFTLQKMAVETAKAEIEAVVRRLTKETGAHRELPWSRAASRRREGRKRRTREG